MFSYEFGLLVAFGFWLWFTGAALIAINSQLERNLNKIGQRLSWLTLAPKPMDADERNQPAWRSVLKFVLLYGTALPFVLTSWIYVAYSVATFLYRLTKDRGAPQAVTEFRWKLRNADLSFDDLVRESMKASGQDVHEFETVRTGLRTELAERGF